MEEVGLELTWIVAISLAKIVGGIHALILAIVLFIVIW